MEKIKSIFRPGGDQDDNVMYGTPEPKNIHAQGGSHDHEDVGPAMLQTDPQSETGKSQGIKSQILNPGGDKYDENRYGTTAHSDKPLNEPTTGTESHAATDTSQIESEPAANNKGGIMRQILNPGGDKYDEQRYGETGKVVPGTTLSRPKQMVDTDSCLSIKSGMRGPYAAQADGSMDAGTQPSSTGQGLSSSTEHHYGRDAALGGGAGAAGLGAYELSKDRDTAGSSGIGGSLPDRTAQGTSGSTMQPHGAEPHMGNISTDRSFPLSGGATSASASDPAQRYGADEAFRQDPSSASQSHLGRDAALGAGAGAIGGGVLAHESRQGQSSSYDDPASTSGLTGSSGLGDSSRGLTGGAASGVHTHGDSAGFHHDDEKPYEGYVHHAQGPHATDIANRLDPHVPGEFPTETGEDPHAGQFGRDAAIGGAGLGAAGLGAAGYEASKSRGETGSSTLPSTSSATTREELPTEQPQHHYGRDAALGGGAGAAGLGAYELSKDHGDKLPTTVLDPSTTSSAATSGQGYPSQTTSSTARDELSSEQPKHHYGRDAALGGGAGAAGVGAYELSKNHGDNLPSTNIADDPSSSQYTGGHHYPNQKAREELGVPPEPPQHHYGRDAAVGGGAGAAGVGAYEATKGRGDTGPASKTVGPHDSNVANIVDPRVQPEPSKMKDPNPSGPYSSNIANKTDPRVPSEPATSAEKEHHYGRDTAVVGGAGAAGAGAYEATQGHGLIHQDQENAIPAPQWQAAAYRQEHRHEHNKLHKKNDPRGQEYAQYTDDKHEKDLQKAREEEAAKGGDHGEKKEGFLHKLLHHGDKDKHAKEATAGGAVASGAAPENERGRHMGTDDTSGLGSTGNTSDERVIEPHTGLPMNVGKYGTYGGGGTDGAQQIEGYHETDPALRHAQHGTGELSHGHHAGEEGVAGPDWDAIKKKNTPY
ncbi:hypothetical protein LTR85_000188 [Meristemomyces frigidus]|nr:hypothetical protein LTR85_000188 [Meristemomyces frigidus]